MKSSAEAGFPARCQAGMALAAQGPRGRHPDLWCAAFRFRGSGSRLQPPGDPRIGGGRRRRGPVRDLAPRDPEQEISVSVGVRGGGRSVLRTGLGGQIP
jgi:hypothetical protein